MKLSVKMFVTRVFLISSVLGTMFVGCLLWGITDGEIDAYYSQPQRKEEYDRVERNIENEQELTGELFITQSPNHSWLNDKNRGNLYVVGDCFSHALARWVHQVCLKYKRNNPGDTRYENVWRECLPANFKKISLHHGNFGLLKRGPDAWLCADQVTTVWEEIRKRYPDLFKDFELKFKFTESYVRKIFVESGMVPTLSSVAKYAKGSLLSVTDCVEMVKKVMGVEFSEKEAKQMFADDQFAEVICEKTVNGFVERFFSSDERFFAIAENTAKNLKNIAFDRIIKKLKEKYSYERLDDALEKLKEKYLTNGIPDEILEGAWSQEKFESKEKLIYFFNMFKEIMKDDFDEKDEKNSRRYAHFTEDLFGSDIFLDLARIIEDPNGTGPPTLSKKKEKAKEKRKLKKRKEP